jgi:hypothetical protein
MIKEQVLILKIKYDDEYEQTPHTWNWTEMLGSDYEVEVLNHGTAESKTE